MIDQLSEGSAGWVDDPLEDLIEEFESRWNPESRESIQQIVSDHGLTNDSEAITELIRIDIEFRYKHGIDLQLDEYFDRFPIVAREPEAVNDVAFEDFRSRAASGLVTKLDRYASLPGVSEQSWFIELKESPEFATTRIHDNGETDHLRPAEETVSELRLESAGFRVIQQIGHGKFSRVYLAQQRALSNRYVVLKVVHEALTEPENMAMLLHTNIVPIYSFHEIDLCSVICMPYAGCITLENFIGEETGEKSRTGQSLVDTVRGTLDSTVISDKETKKPSEIAPLINGSADLLPLERLNSLNTSELGTWIFARLAAALAHSHARGVLHGDLKPANVLIRNDGEPALMDFNLSHQPDQVRKHIGGTVPYMSPETLRAMLNPRRLTSNFLPKNEHPDERADIYSLGVMLFQFVTGRHAFPLPPSSADADLERAIQNRERSLDWRESDSVSPGLRAIIDHAIEVNPSDRYQTAEALQQDLDCERKGLSLVNTKEPYTSRFRKWVSRHPNLTSGFSVGALLLSCLIPVAVIAVTLRAKNASLSATLAFQQFEAESNDYLSSIAVDPNRASSENIDKGMEVLLKHGVLEKTNQHLLLDTPNEEPRNAASTSLLRHVVQVARLEVERLRALNTNQPLGETELARLDELMEAVNQLPQSKPSRAITYLRSSRMGFIDKSAQRKLAKKAVVIEANSDTEEYLEAVRLLSLHKFKEAQEILTGLADRDCIPAKLRWTSLGRSQYGETRYEDAKISFTQSIERAPRSAQLYVYRGQCYLQLKHLQFAEQDFSRAIELEPGNKTALSHRGKTYLQLNQVEKAEDDFSRILDIDPQNAFALLMRSEVYRRLGKPDLAEADCELALNVETDDPSSLMFRKHVRLKRDDVQGALSDLRKANQLRPGTPKILTELAVVYAREGDLETSLSYYNQAVEANPLNENARIDRAIVLAKLGRYIDALTDLDSATKGPNSGRTLYNAACVCSLLPKEHHLRGLRYLASAIRAGYEANNLREDSDLDALRSLQGFQAISRTFRMANASESMR